MYTCTSVARARRDRHTESIKILISNGVKSRGRANACFTLGWTYEWRRLFNIFGQSEVGRRSRFFSPTKLTFRLASVCMRIVRNFSYARITARPFFPLAFDTVRSAFKETHLNNKRILSEIGDIELPVERIK